MALQETLFVAGIVVLGIAAVFFGIATYIFFDRNIPSILEELNGTEHVETLVAAEKKTSDHSSRRSAGEVTKQISLQTDSMETGSAESMAVASSQTMVEHVASASRVSESDNVVVMENVTSDMMVMYDGASGAVVKDLDVASRSLLTDTPLSNASVVVAYRDESVPTAVSDDQVVSSTTKTSNQEQTNDIGYLAEVMPKDNITGLEAAIHPQIQMATPNLAPYQFHIVRKIVLVESVEFIKPG